MLLRNRLLLQAPLLLLLSGPGARAQFVQQGNKLVGSGAVPDVFTGHTFDDYQGSAVAMSADGNTMAVGGWNDNGGIGAVWIFTRSNGVWSQQGDKLVGFPWAPMPNQGWAVALSADGNTLLEGGAFDSSTMGAVWVFTRQNGTWTQQGQKLLPFDAAGKPQFGTSVALSADGNTAIAGGPYDSCSSASICLGAAWVFRRINGQWTPLAKLTGDLHPYSPGPLLGASVALSADGNTALLGGPNDQDANGNLIGGAWVFTHNSDGSWSQQELVGTGGVGPDVEQGWFVTLSAYGDTVAVAGPMDDNHAGAAWVFTRVNGVWSQQAKLVGGGAVGPAHQGGAGLSLSADGNTLLVSGWNDNNSAGAVWVFQRANGTWAQQGNKLVGTGASAGAEQGSSVALSADASTAVEGGINDNNNMGAAWVFVQPRANHFSISAPASITAGVPFTFTACVLDPNNNVVPGYTRTVRFTSTDSSAVLPATTTLINGTGTFWAILNSGLSQTITATDTFLSSITGTSSQVAISNGTPGTMPRGVLPPYGSGRSQLMTFTFYDPRGAQDLNVVNILINNFLDGRHACYLAYSHPSKTLYLVGDDGAALSFGMTPGGSEQAGNSQCLVTADVSSFSDTGDTLTLNIYLAFTPSFAGNKIVYLAARDRQGGNSGWQPMGTWSVPWSGTFPSVTGLSPARGGGSSQTFTVTFADSNGTQDLGVVNVLINNALDGRQACYVAYSQIYKVLYLVADVGAGISPGLKLGGSGSVSNSQCTINASGSSASTSGSTLTLVLNIAFTPSFDGNRVIYAAARDVAEANNSGWQAMGIWTVQ